MLRDRFSDVMKHLRFDSRATRNQRLHTQRINLLWLPSHGLYFQFPDLRSALKSATGEIRCFAFTWALKEFRNKRHLE
ncbi:hypothetical protein J437_LFUL007892 [Ladona fulva]|uniref:Uncharacterized protein n=1 Tax=Ladona fulva TaxID=123851 RepID=A0A8K0P1M2_LADFU|nr:hypothetical protein J437_LFUL007892 [Ladona fulva]